MVQELFHSGFGKRTIKGDRGGGSAGEDDESGVACYAEHFVGGGFFVADLGEGNAVKVFCGEDFDQGARGAFVAEENSFGGIIIGLEPGVETFVRYPLNVVRDGGFDGVDDVFGGSPAIVVFYGWFAGLLGGFDKFQGGKSLDTHAATESLVAFVVAIDGGDLCQAIETLGSFLVGGLEVLAMTAPWGVES